MHHSITAPFGLSADYLHPLEFASMSLGGAVAAMCVGAHLTTTAVFFAVGNGGGVLNHCGFRMPWTPDHLKDPGKAEQRIGCLLDVTTKSDNLCLCSCGLLCRVSRLASHPPQLQPLILACDGLVRFASTPHLCGSHQRFQRLH